LYNRRMAIIFLQTVWTSLLALGWIKVIIAVVIIGVLSRVNSLLGLLGFLLFVAYLAQWIK
jgi:hypothetical protein